MKVSPVSFVLVISTLLLKEKEFQIQNVMSKSIKKLECDGTKMWYVNNILHRTDGPAVERKDGTCEWYLNGLLHREDGPAIECSNGTEYWYKNGERHRTNGPAISLSYGDKYWYLNDKLHREDGPAVERKDGLVEYWYRGKQINADHFFSDEFKIQSVMEE